MDRHGDENPKLSVLQVQIPLEANFFANINLPLTMKQCKNDICQLCVSRENSNRLKTVGMPARYLVAFELLNFSLNSLSSFKLWM